MSTSSIATATWATSSCSAFDRPGPYGGTFENRTRFLREIVAGIRATTPGLGIGVRFSAFDFVPFRPGSSGTGEPEPLPGERYDYAFGGDGTGTGIDLTEPKRFVDLLAELDIPLVCMTSGSPYYNPHLQRPALFPPSDGYQPPEDPLVGVARAVWVAGQLKQHRPELAYVGSGYTYLQEWLPNVAQHMVRTGRVDFVGLGRMMLCYPDLRGRRPGRPASPAQAHLPHLQRLHHGAPERHGFRLLSARSLLHRKAGGRPTGRRQG